MGCRVVLGVVGCQVFPSWSPINNEMALIRPILKQIKSHINFFGLLLLDDLANPTNAVLSTSMVVEGGWGWPISIKYMRISMPWFVTMCAAPISASAAYSITNLSILHIMCMGLLRVYSSMGFLCWDLLLRKNEFHLYYVPWRRRGMMHCYVFEGTYHWLRTWWNNLGM